MVRGKGQETDSNPLMDLLGLLFSKTILLWLGIALLLILLPAHIVWLLERRHPNGILPTEKYFPGIFHAMYWRPERWRRKPSRCRGNGWRGSWRCCGCLPVWCSLRSTPRS